MTTTATPCRLCPEPATVTLSVRPGKATWSLGDPLCQKHADHIAGIMRIPVRFVPIATAAVSA